MLVQWPGQTKEQAEQVALVAPEDFYEPFGVHTFTFSSQWVCRLAQMTKLGDWIADLRLQILMFPGSPTHDSALLRPSTQDEAQAFGMYFWLLGQNAKAVALWRSVPQNARFEIMYLYGTHSWAELKRWCASHNDPDQYAQLTRGAMLKNTSLLERVGTPAAFLEAGIICAETGQDASIAFFKQAIQKGAENGVSCLFSYHPHLKEDRALLEALCTPAYNAYERAHAELARYYWRHQHDDPAFRPKLFEHAVRAGPVFNLEMLWAASNDELRDALPDELLDIITTSYGTLDYKRWFAEFRRHIANTIGFSEK